MLCLSKKKKIAMLDERVLYTRTFSASRYELVTWNLPVSLARTAAKGSRVSDIASPRILTLSRPFTGRSWGNGHGLLRFPVTSWTTENTGLPPTIRG